MYNPNPRVQKIVSIGVMLIFGVMGLGMIIVGVLSGRFLLHYSKIENSGQITVGQITGYHHNVNRSGIDISTTYKFLVNGQEYSNPLAVQYINYSDYNPSANDQIQVKYLPSDPGLNFPLSVKNSAVKLSVYAQLVFGFILGPIFLVVITKYLRKYGRSDSVQS